MAMLAIKSVAQNLRCATVRLFSAIYNELKSLGYDVEYEKEPLEDGVLVKMKIMW